MNFQLKTYFLIPTNKLIIKLITPLTSEELSIFRMVPADATMYAPRAIALAAASKVVIPPEPIKIKGCLFFNFETSEIE